MRSTQHPTCHELEHVVNLLQGLFHASYIINTINIPRTLGSTFTKWVNHALVHRVPVSNWELHPVLHWLSFTVNREYFFWVVEVVTLCVQEVNTLCTTKEFYLRKVEQFWHNVILQNTFKICLINQNLFRFWLVDLGNQLTYEIYYRVPKVRMQPFSCDFLLNYVTQKQKTPRNKLLDVFYDNFSNFCMRFHKFDCALFTSFYNQLASAWSSSVIVNFNS